MLKFQPCKSRRELPASARTPRKAGIYETLLRLRQILVLGNRMEQRDVSYLHEGLQSRASVNHAADNLQLSILAAVARKVTRYFRAWGWGLRGIVYAGEDGKRDGVTLAEGRKRTPCRDTRRNPQGEEGNERRPASS